MAVGAQIMVDKFVTSGRYVETVFLNVLIPRQVSKHAKVYSFSLLEIGKLILKHEKTMILLQQLTN